MYKPNHRGGAWEQLLTWPAAAFHYVAGKWKSIEESKQMLQQAEALELRQDSVAELTAAWRRLGVGEAEAGGLPDVSLEASAALGTNPHPGASSPSPLPLGDAERAIVHRIREETRRLNRNNVTRTEAYRAIYGRHPELHWAMLAHIVSRNGGWNMTDLRGEWLPRLLGPERREPTFRLLERANALIFQDAYPQLLLYEAGARIGRDLTHLLPAFGVSRFMAPVWRQFVRRRDPVPLTVALIVNEQHYIERRVVKHPYFRKHVLGTLFFGMQSLLQLNQVIMPYRFERRPPGGPDDESAPAAPPGRDSLRLAGFVLESFDSLRERIEFGKRLYAVLFGVPEVRDGVHRFARAVRHTGSRSDYAPHLFAAVRHRPPQRPYRERLAGLRLRPGAEPLYSPPLSDAWPDVPVEPPGGSDWFESPRMADDYFKALPLPKSFELTNEYGAGLGKLELAVLTAEELGAARSGPPSWP